MKFLKPKNGNTLNLAFRRHAMLLWKKCHRKSGQRKSESAGNEIFWGLLNTIHFHRNRTRLFSTGGSVIVMH